MSVANRKPSSRYGQPVPPTVKTASLPASVGGINALDALMAMPPTDAIYTFNLMPVEYGLRLRKGYRQWAVGLDGDVRTIIPYESSSSNPALNRLFAVTDQGIYDVTASTGAVSADIVDEDGGDDFIIDEGGDDLMTEGAVPLVALVDFTEHAEPAGYGVYTEWTNDASNHYLFYADGLNGVFQYTELGGWAVPTGWTYDDPDNPGTSIPFPVEDVAFIMAHKLRLWVILENSDDAYYSPIASVAGDFKKFTFGAKMPKGGNLQGLFTWSLDGGNGVDDYLVGISRGGDVLVYRGSDPELPDWTMVGSWFVGQTTRSRRLVCAQGSDMYILSIYGITSLRDLVQGSVANLNPNSPSAKVNRFLRADIQKGKERYDWQVVSYPGDGFLQIVTPEPSNTPFLQYNQNTATQAWGFWEGVPMLCGDTWNGDYFMGSPDGVVLIYDGVVDGATLDGEIGQPINFRTLTSFQAPEGDHASFKRCSMIRTIGVISGTISLNARVVFDYDVNAALPPPVVLPPSGDNLWDSGVWDTSVWDFTLAGHSILAGSLGMGRVMAIGIVGSAANRINIAGWDAMYTTGGLL